ncbi:MAG: hypothetical protein HY648_01835 [Acidobacteria bacterium]|nr:hypothetical protein [Acidobacteriota bacterium]
MSIEAALILGFPAFLVGWLCKPSSVVEEDRNSDALLASRLDGIERMLEEIQNRLDDSVEPSDEDQHRFKCARAITLADARRWAHGDTMRLISKSYYYPTEGPSLADFEYRHDRVDTAEQNGFGFEVLGWRRFSSTDEWTPYRFLANEKECTTSSCEGTIRKLS